MTHFFVLFWFFLCIQQLFCVLSTDPYIPWAAQGCSSESPCFEASSWEGQRHSGPESEHRNWGVCRPHVFHREPEQTGVLYGSRKRWLLKLPPFWCILSLFELERNGCNSFLFCLLLEVLQGWTKTCADEGLRYVEAWSVRMFYITQVCVLPPLYHQCVVSEGWEISTFQHHSLPLFTSSFVCAPQWYGNSSLSQWDSFLPPPLSLSFKSLVPNRSAL